MSTDDDFFLLSHISWYLWFASSLPPGIGVYIVVVVVLSRRMVCS